MRSSKCNRSLLTYSKSTTALNKGESRHLYCRSFAHGGISNDSWCFWSIIEVFLKISERVWDYVGLCSREKHLRTCILQQMSLVHHSISTLSMKNKLSRYERFPSGGRCNVTFLGKMTIPFAAFQTQLAYIYTVYKETFSVKCFGKLHWKVG